jgi:hypothetical protein
MLKVKEVPLAYGFLLLEIIEEDIFTLLFEYNHGFFCF